MTMEQLDVAAEEASRFLMRVEAIRAAWPEHVEGTPLPQSKLVAAVKRSSKDLGLALVDLRRTAGGYVENA